MSDNRPNDVAGESAALGDRPARVAIRAVEPLGRGFRPYERMHIRIEDQEPAQDLDRDVLRCGEVVGVLPIDLRRREVVLLRQFRLAAHLATGRGDAVELVAGRVEPGESAEAAARRECGEEIGLEPLNLVPILSFMPAPAFADEVMRLWLAVVDARVVPDRAGNAGEDEVTRPFRLAMDGVGALLDGGVANAPLIIALQWLRANRAAIEAMRHDADGSVGERI